HSDKDVSTLGVILATPKDRDSRFLVGCAAQYDGPLLRFPRRVCRKIDISREGNAITQGYSLIELDTHLLGSLHGHEDYSFFKYSGLDYHPFYTPDNLIQPWIVIRFGRREGARVRTVHRKA